MLAAVACALLALVGAVYGHFHCDPADCTCGRSAYDSYELDCPKSNPLWPVAMLSVQHRPNATVALVCTTTTIEYRWLAGLRFGHVPTVSFTGCPLPDKSLAQLMRSLGINSTTTLMFQSNMNLSAILQQQHLQGLDTIKTLILSLNGLSTLPQGIFNRMSNLTALDLRSNNIQLHPHLFNNTTSLRRLELGMNKMSSIEPGIFQHLTKLQELNLWGNELHNLTKETFTGLFNLITLDLSENSISSVPTDVFVDLGSLKNLSLYGNSFTSLPQGLFTGTQVLELLRLNSNRKTLAILPDGLLANLTALREVYLHDCNISQMPQNLLWGSPNISILQLSKNALTDFPKLLFRDAKNLTELDISHNKLTTFPDSLFASLSRLHILRLDHNHISNITEAMLQGLMNLKWLYLNNNALHHIDADTFRSTRNLLEIDLSHNHISFNKTSPLQHCAHLEVLQLDNNAITRIPADWRTMHTKLNKLNLSQNAISYLEFQDIYFQSEQLTVDLTYNNIATVNLTNAEAAVFDRQNSRVHNVNIKLDGNPLHCDCKIYDLLRYLEYKIAPEVHVAVNIEADNLMCASPNDLAGLPVSGLKSRTLGCRWSQQCPRPCLCLLRPEGRVLVVNCSATGLSQAPQRLPDLQAISSIELLLDHNSLSTLPETTPASYSKVSRLSLSHNSISHLSNSSLPQHLKVLEIDHNNLTNLEKPLVESFSRMHSIALQNNPWNCDCELQHLLSFLQSNPKQVESSKGITCAGRYGATLADLSETDLCSSLHWEAVAAASIAIALAATVIGLLAALYLNYQRTVRTRFYSCKM